MELKPITISFKDVPEEVLLYSIISQHSSKGAFIKDTLIQVLIRKEAPENTEVIKVQR